MHLHGQLRMQHLVMLKYTDQLAQDLLPTLLEIKQIFLLMTGTKQ